MATEKIFFAVEVETGNSVSSLGKLKQAIIADEQALKKLRKEVSASGKATNKQAQAITKLDVALKKNRKAYNDSAKAAAGLEKKTSRLSKAFNKVAVGIGQAFAARAVFNAIGDTINIVRDFEQAAADVASVLGKTTEETEKLQKAAMDLGSTTIFTATQVQELQKELAKLGFSEQQILASQEAILQLAAATGTDLARAAEVAASTVRSLGLTADDTQTVVDVMAKSFSSSGLDLERFAEAMKLVAPSAKATGRDLQKVTSQLGLLADNGINGSLAGTQLNRVFIELNKKGLTLEQALEKVSGAQNKLGKATELVGDRGAKALLIFSENSEKLGELEGKLRDAGGAAQKMADTQLDTLNGQMKLLNSAWEGFVLSLEKGDGILGSILKGSIATLADALAILTGNSETLDDRLAELGERTHLGRVADDLIELRESEQDLISKGFELNKVRETALRIAVNALETLKESRNLWGSEVDAIDARIAALKKANDEAGELTSNKEDEIVVTIDLIKEKREEIKLAGKMSGANETDIAIRNTKIEGLKEELKALQDLRVEEEVKAEAEAEFSFKKLEQMESEKVAQLEAVDESMAVFNEETESLNAAKLERDLILLDSASQGLQSIQNLTNTFTDNKLRELDKETRSELKIINKREAEGLISKDKAEQQRRKLQTDSDEKSEAIEKKAFKRNKAFRLAEIGLNLAGELSAIALAAAQNPTNAITFGAAGVSQAAVLSGVAIALAATNIAAVGSQKFAKGGIIQGASHAQGGVPIMGGRAEVEGGEIILSKGVTRDPTLAAAANQLNIMGGGKSFLQNGGFTPNKSTTFALPESGASEELSQIVDAIADLQLTVNVSEISRAQSNIKAVERQASI